MHPLWKIALFFVEYYNNIMVSIYNKLQGTRSLVRKEAN